MKNVGKDMEGKARLRVKDQKLGFSEKGTKRIWTNCMVIMNIENNGGLVTEGNMMVGPVEKVTRKKIVIATRTIKSGKAAVSSEVCAQIISDSGGVGI